MPILGAASAAARVAASRNVPRTPVPAPVQISIPRAVYSAPAPVYRAPVYQPPAPGRGPAPSQAVAPRAPVAVQRNAPVIRGQTSTGALVTALPRTGAAQRAYLGSGAQGFPLGMAYPAMQQRDPFPDRDLASGIQTLLQRSTDKTLEPSSQEHLRYLAHRLIGEVYPDMPIDGLSDQALLATLRLAEGQDYEYQKPPPRQPKRTEGRNSSQFFGQGPREYDESVPPIYNLTPDDLGLEQRSRPNRWPGERSSSQFFGQAQTRGRSGAQQAFQRAASGAEQTQQLHDESNVGAILAERAEDIDLTIRRIQNAIAEGTASPEAVRSLPGLLKSQDDVARQLSEENDKKPTIIQTISNLGHEDIGAIRDALFGNPITGTAISNPVTRPIAKAVQAAAQAALSFVDQDFPGQEFGPSVMVDGGLAALKWWGENAVKPVQRHAGQALYNYAGKKDGDWYDPLNPMTFIMKIAVDVDNVFGDGSFGQKVIDHYEQGYTNEAGDLISGPEAVWEEDIIGAANDKPWPIKYAWIMMGEILTDPATLAGGAGRVGSGLNLLGRTISAIPKATMGEKIAGGALRATGSVVKHAGTGLDTLGLEYLVARPATWIGRKAGGSLGDESIAVERSEALRTNLAAERGAVRAGVSRDLPTPPAAGPAAPTAPMPPAPGAGPTAPTSLFPSGITPSPTRPGPPPGSVPLRTPTGSLLPPATAAAPTPGVTRVADDVVIRADPETGLLTPVASAIPDTLPNIRRAATRAADSPAAGTLFRQSGDDLLVPAFGGTRTQDVVFTEGVEAVQRGDLVVARVLDAELDDLEAAAIRQGLGSDPTFMRWEDGGSSISSKAVPFTDAELALFRASPRHSGGGQAAATASRNGAVRGAYEIAHNLLFDARHKVDVFRRLFPDRELPTGANPAFRQRADASFVDERLYWLMEEFVVTPDASRAGAIKAVLNRVSDETGFFRAGASGEPYMTAISPGIKRTGATLSARDEVQALLDLARREYQQAVSRPPRPDHAARIGGGLSGASQKAAKAITEAEAKEAELLVKGALENAEDRLALIDELDIVPPQAAVPTISPSKTGPAIVSLGDTELAVMKVGSHWEVFDDAGAVIGGNPTRKDAITRATQHLQKTVKQIRDDAIDPSTGIVAPGTRRLMGFFDRIEQGRQSLIEAADTSAAPNIRDPHLRFQNERGELSVRDTMFLDQRIVWKPPGKATPGLEDYEWSVWDAMNWVNWKKANDLTFKPEPVYQKIAELATKFDYDSFSALAKGIDKFGKLRLVKWYDNALNVIQRQHRRYGPLTGLRNMAGDEMGTTYQLLVMGEWGAAWDMSPWNLFLDNRSYRRQYGRDPHQIAEALDDPFLAGTGQLPPKKLMPGVSRGEDPFGGLPDANRKLGKYGWAGRLTANIWTVPYYKDFLNTIDVTSRLSVWKNNYQRIVKTEGNPAFAKTLRELAGDDLVAADWVRRIEAEAQRHVPAGSWDGAFSPGDIRRALDGVTKQNTALARAWQGQLVKASDGALKRTEDVLFSYKNTNLDEIARRIFVFHYWQSRAIPLHIRATLRNPILLSGYYKIYEQLEAISEREGYPDYLSLMLRFGQTPGGINVFGNGPGIALPTTAFDVYDEKGSKFAVLINQMAPPLAATLAVAGVFDQTPNLTATMAEENFYRKLLNYLRGEGVDVSQVPGLGQFIDPVTMDFTNPSEEITKGILEWANQALNQAGIPVGDFEPFDRGANELDQLRTWVQRAAEDEFGPRYTGEGGDIVSNWTPEQVAMYEEALVGIQSGVPGNPLSDAARRLYGHEEGLSAALSLVVPGGSVINSQFRTDIMRASGEFRDADFTGTGAQQAASEYRQEAIASDPAWVIANTQYHNIGTPDQKETYDLYNTLIYDPGAFRERALVVPNGSGGVTTLDASGLVNMTEDQRREFADQWLTQIGMSESIAQFQADRDAFKVANPEYGEYSEYQKGVYAQEDELGGVKGWREDLAQTNPNFKKEMDERRKWLRDQGKTGAVLEAELDQWATSQAGFMAAMGKQDSVYDDAPISVYDGSQDPLNNRGLSFLGPDQGGGESGGASSDDDDAAALGPDGVKPLDKFVNYLEETPEQEFESGRTNQMLRREFANLAAETLYGDAWDYDAVAASGEFKEGSVGTGDDKVFTDYYGDAKPGADKLVDRYDEWAKVYGAQNPGADLSYDSWIAWEAGIRQQAMTGSQLPSIQRAYQGFLNTMGGVPPRVGTGGTGLTYSGQPLGSEVEEFKGAAGGSGSSVTHSGQELEDVVERFKQGDYLQKSSMNLPAKGAYQGSASNGNVLNTMFGGTANVGFPFGENSDNGLYGYGTEYGLNGTQHTGSDVMQPLGTPIYAPGDAVVVCVGCWSNDHMTGGVGRIELEMPDGVHVLYDHSNESYVQIGDTVVAGQQIGTSGGMIVPHIHLEVRVPDSSTGSGWRLIDPEEYLAGL